MGPGFSIRNSTPDDLDDILDINTEAFGQVDEAELVADLLGDETARPLVSLLAFDGGVPVGHILFTRVSVEGENLAAAILAPLAVKPGAQGEGVGGRLICAGLEQLLENGVGLVFVLGHPGYYPKYGFQPAGVLGFQAPYPIPKAHAGAWMVQELIPGLIGSVQGRINCADALDHPEMWRE
jgi:putative acetyltransferase